jgi:hypothetical protein
VIDDVQARGKLRHAVKIALENADPDGRSGHHAAGVADQGVDLGVRVRQRLDEMAADETRGAGDQYLHEN